EPIIQHFNQSVYSRSREVPPEQTRALCDTLSIVTFPVAAELRGTKASMNDLMHLAQGDVLQLDNRVGQLVAIRVSGVAMFYVDLGAHERHTAVYVRGAMKDE